MWQYMVNAPSLVVKEDNLVRWFVCSEILKLDFILGSDNQYSTSWDMFIYMLELVDSL